MKILVTGAAGFIGFHISLKLLERGESVVGLDNVNNYYNPKLKEDRLAILTRHSNFQFVRASLEDRHTMERLFHEHQFQKVIHLAAQAGVRYSIDHPHAYVDSNITGFLNILEGCRHEKVEHLTFASSSSVYGANSKLPFTEGDSTDHPISVYAATKKANELMAHTYAHLYRIPMTGLRFFTVYGPWGRPDMALFLFTQSILEGKTIDVFNNGQMRRDFTYIDDVVEGVIRASDLPATSDPLWDSARPHPASSAAPYRIYNIGNSQPAALIDFIEAIEEATCKKAQKRFLPMQPGDVLNTFADVSKLESAVGFKPVTSIREGVRHFVKWYRDYYGI